MSRSGGVMRAVAVAAEAAAMNIMKDMAADMKIVATDKAFRQL